MRQIVLSYAGDLAAGEMWRPLGGERVLPLMNQIGALSLISTHADDEGGSPGVSLVRVLYLDIGGRFRSVDVVMTARVSVLAGVNAYRVLGLEALACGASGSNAGVVTASIAGDDQLEMPPLRGGAHGAVFTVPLGFCFECSHFDPQRLNMVGGVRLEARRHEAGVVGPWFCVASFRGPPSSIPLRFGGLTDIRIVSSANGNGPQVFTLVGSLVASPPYDPGALPPRMDTASAWAP